MDDQSRQHLPPALYGRSEVYSQEDETDDPDVEERDTNPCSPPDEEESPESDRLPVEYPHLSLAHRFDD